MKIDGDGTGLRFFKFVAIAILLFGVVVASFLWGAGSWMQ